MADRFSISAGTQQAIIARLAARGIRTTNTYRTRLAIEVSGSVAAIEQAFQVSVNDYRMDGGTYFGNPGNVVLAGPLVGHVLSVLGLSNYGGLQSQLRFAPEQPHGNQPPGVMPGATRARVAPDTVVPFLPANIAGAYGVTPLYSAGITGTGETIAITSIGMFTPTDVISFWAQSGITRPLPTVVPVDGGTTGFDAETTVDVSWSGALAPGANVEAYLAPTASYRDFADMFNQVASDDNAGAVSTSWDACETTWEYGGGLVPSSLALAAAASEGIKPFVAAGDSGTKTSGCWFASANYPATDPSETSVGGTNLTLDSQNRIVSETDWNDVCGDSGGAPSNIFSEPAWQVGLNVPQNGHRNQADVALDAGCAPNPYEIVFDGQPFYAGGTSFGAPEWAAMSVLQHEYAVAHGYGPFSYPYAANIYDIAGTPAYASAMHDITSGCSDVYCAQSGWDFPTGWGSPNLIGLAQAIVTLPTPTPAPPTPTPTPRPATVVSDYPSAGPPDSWVTLSAVHVVAGAVVTFVWGGPTAGVVLGAVKGSSAGAVSLRTLVQPNPGGTYVIYLVDGSDYDLGSTTFTESGAARLAPTSGPPGTRVQVAGAGFATGELVAIGWDSPSNVLEQATVDQEGGLADVVVRAPMGLAGAHIVYLTGLQSGTVATATYQVTGLVRVSPIAAEAGDAIVVAGKGYSATTSYQVQWQPPARDGPAVPIGAVTSDALGNLGPVTVTVPTTAVIGTGTVQVAASSRTTTALARTGVPVVSPTRQTLVLAPTWGSEEANMDVAGFGFTPGATINMTWTVAGHAYPNGSFTADFNGRFTASAWPDPHAPYGMDQVTAQQAASKVHAQTFYFYGETVAAHLSTCPAAGPCAQRERDGGQRIYSRRDRDVPRHHWHVRLDRGRCLRRRGRPAVVHAARHAGRGPVPGGPDRQRQRAAHHADGTAGGLRAGGHGQPLARVFAGARVAGHGVELRAIRCREPFHEHRRRGHVAGRDHLRRARPRAEHVGVDSVRAATWHPGRRPSLRRAIGRDGRHHVYRAVTVAGHGPRAR